MATRRSDPYANRGRAPLFTRDVCVEAAWRVVQPVSGNAGAVVSYDPGSWGPAIAARVVQSSEGWHDPKPEAAAPC